MLDGSRFKTLFFPLLRALIIEGKGLRPLSPHPLSPRPAAFLRFAPAVHVPVGIRVHLRRNPHAGSRLAAEFSAFKSLDQPGYRQRIPVNAAVRLPRGNLMQSADRCRPRLRLKRERFPP